MKSCKRWIWPALVLLSMAGCKGGMVRADAIQGLVGEVAERHDRYVAADATLTEQQRSIFTRSTELLRAVIAEAMKSQ